MAGMIRQTESILCLRQSVHTKKQVPKKPMGSLLLDLHAEDAKRANDWVLGVRFIGQAGEELRE